MKKQNIKYVVKKYAINQNVNVNSIRKLFGKNKMGGDWKDMVEAAKSGQLGTVRLHVLNGIDVNFQHYEFQTTPLIEAARFGHIDIVEFLLENNADPSIKSTFDEKTALDVAQEENQAKIIELLRAR